MKKDEREKSSSIRKTKKRLDRTRAVVVLWRLVETEFRTKEGSEKQDCSCPIYPIRNPTYPSVLCLLVLLSSVEHDRSRRQDFHSDDLEHIYSPINQTRETPRGIGYLYISSSSLLPSEGDSK